MKHWEFLLQKEGDRSWLPLDSPDVEILEGRYRLVARSSLVNAEIDIRIVHLATEDTPPKRRVQKRSCRTNQEGLMVVIPFTQLEPGLWELHCSPADLMSDLMAGAQPYSVKLQVLARETEDDEWEPDWSAQTATNAEADRPATQSQPLRLADEAAFVAFAAQDEVAAEPAIAEPAIDQPPFSNGVAANGEAAVLPPEVAEILGASMDRLFQIAAQMSEQLVDEVLQDFDLSAIADDAQAAPSPASVTAVPSEPFVSAASVVADAVSAATGYTLPAGAAFTLLLDQTAFVATRSEALTVAGRIAIEASAVPTQTATSVARSSTARSPDELDDPWEAEDNTLDLTGATAQEVQLCLRDPQSLQVLVSDRQPLPPGAPPFSFTFSVSLPETLTTHLVLGEVLLCGVLPAKPETSLALSTQAFSITVDPAELVGELAKLNHALSGEIEDEERIDLPLELSSRLKEQETASLNLSFLNLVVAEPPEARSPGFPSLAGQPLPPQIYYPDPAVRSKPLHLPAFSSIMAVSIEPDTVPAAQDAVQAPKASLDLDRSAGEPADEPAIATPSLTEATPGVSTPTDDSPAPAQPAQVSEDGAEGGAIAQQSVMATPDTLSPVSTATDEPAKDNATNTTAQPSLDLPSPTYMAFQSLKLQDRFLTRLTSLATDTELSALLRANMAPGSPMPFSSAAVAPSAADVHSLAQEIVVDDEPPSSRRRAEATQAPANHPTQNGSIQPPSDGQNNPLILPDDTPVPMPALEVTTGELIAGKPINIRVKLPNLLPRIYVKLWITDRQTRSLLDGPRWLVDFLPNGLGDLEAMTPLTVPFGSLGIRFEAIAVEMHTQRESHKVTIDRAVVPPDLPIVSLDDFNA